MTSYFLSDLHLDDVHSSRLRAMDELLTEASRQEADIYILGDLVEVWVGDDDDCQFAQQLRDTLRRHGERTSLFLMHGNRDFLFGRKFADDVQATLLEDPSIIQLNGQPVLLSHGDMFCTSDTAYQQMRQLFRSSDFQSHFLSQDIEARRDFARTLREQSKKSNANKPAQITDVVEDSVRDALNLHDCSTAIHGHTHRPGHHDLGNGLTRYVLGSWERCGWYARFQSELALECFAIDGGPE